MNHAAPRPRGIEIGRVGTRASPLARRQAMLALSAWNAAHSAKADPAHELVLIRTRGDQVQDRVLSEIGGKGLFTRELDDALLEGRIDLAVHSLKDMPARLPDRIAMAAVLEREDPRDALIRTQGPVGSLDELAPEAVVGTSSLRRRAQILHRRPDLQVRPLRGNVETRLRRIREGRVEATLLAAAGLRRLGRHDLAGAPLPVNEMLPAGGQGAIALTCRRDDLALRESLKALDHAPTRIETEAERALLAALDGDCRTPVATLARMRQGRIDFRASFLSADGRTRLDARREGAPGEASDLGREAGEELVRRMEEAGLR